jgi:hypothetical protein
VNERDIRGAATVEFLQRWGISASGIEEPALYVLVGALLALVAFNVLRFFFDDEFSVAARVGICALVFLFGLLLMWVTEPFFGDHMSDTQKESWVWALRIVVYASVPAAVGWLARRKAMRIAARSSTTPRNDA